MIIDILFVSSIERASTIQTSDLQLIYHAYRYQILLLYNDLTDANWTFGRSNTIITKSMSTVVQSSWMLH